ncbi:hypothetical protein B0A48_05013 [Cryoendolithus antarcticus]|uniref:EamA domain-containing protein n=1 Tax=Cryoendolithus antarcticus TaxID=1507870 RepID=A0A1V8TEC0_9PEZI|nr:hypothetical protein B0A48_05013 [Cryoendolithus antarcticus]
MTESRPSWLPYTIASGACAALNGVFAKLTTTSLTSSWSSAVSSLLGLGNHNTIIETVIRGVIFNLRCTLTKPGLTQAQGFFACNLIFNAVMWGLFTKALTLASSTVRVSVLNTSANFFVTAILGWGVFGEKLPALWWLGASLLVAGSVIIGRREEDKGEAPDAREVTAVGEEGYTDEPDAPLREVARAGTSIELQEGGRVRSRSRDRHVAGERD